MLLAIQGVYQTSLELLQFGQGDKDSLVKEIVELSARAVQADPANPRVWVMRSGALMFQSKFDGALQANDEALRLDPDHLGALLGRANLLFITDRAEEVFPVINRAFARGTTGWEAAELLYMRCRAHLLLGHYDDAIKSCEQASALSYWWPGQVHLIAAYAQKGNMAKALAVKEELLKHAPGLSIHQLKEFVEHWDNAKVVQQREMHLYPGLRKAGMPEQ